MSKITRFEPQFAFLLPVTHAILESADLTLHPAVSLITLHGSRALAGGYRTDSDIDLSLIVEPRQDTLSDLQAVLNNVLEVTLGNWQSGIELDLAAVFDTRNCGLKCFERTTWDEHLCSIGGVDCFGLYKIQKGFHGFVVNAGVQVKLMYPCIPIWRRR